MKFYTFYIDGESVASTAEYEKFAMLANRIADSQEHVEQALEWAKHCKAGDEFERDDWAVVCRDEGYYCEYEEFDSSAED